MGLFFHIQSLEMEDKALFYLHLPQMDDGELFHLHLPKLEERGSPSARYSIRSSDFEGRGIFDIQYFLTVQIQDRSIIIIFDI